MTSTPEQMAKALREAEVRTDDPGVEHEGGYVLISHQAALEIADALDPPKTDWRERIRTREGSTP